jgi:hypothetical protein
MDNLKLPSAPLSVCYDTDERRISPSNDSDDWGFTKLEMAALMIAQGMAHGARINKFEINDLITRAVEVAKALLEETNK